MPISAANMRLYPGGGTHSPEWREIRERIQERAGDRCEQCGVDNHAIGYRQDGRFVMVPTAALKHKTLSDVTGIKPPLLSLDPKLIRIVCTTAHVDGQLTDHSDENLRFWCQYCHLRHDRDQHLASRKARRDAERGNHGSPMD